MYHAGIRTPSSCIFILIIPFALLGQATFSQQDRFENTKSVVAVEVPVTVLRDGQPVREMTADDFEIVDSGRKQEITGFEVIDLETLTESEAGIAASEVPLIARRHFLLLFDLSFSEVASIARAREAALQLVNEGLHPSDLVGVASYSESRGTQIILGFTPDREQLARAVDRLDVANPNRHFSDPLGLEMVEFDPGGGVAGGGGVSGRPSEAGGAELLYLAQRADSAIKRNQILALSSALGSLARLMNSVQGRKHVIFLSEGFDSSIFLGSPSARMAENISRGQYWLVDTDDRYGSGAAQTAVARMVEEFRRADCTVHAVDIGGARVPGANDRGSKGEGGLFFIANETGGEFFRNYNQLDVAMGEVLERSAVTYVLTFQPPNLESDGSYHRLKVRLKSGGSGARLVHRPGYYAPRPLSELSATERRFNAAGLIVGGSDGGELDTALLAAAFPSNGSRAYVPVFLEVDGSTLLANRQVEVIPTEIYVYAIAADGKIVDHFSRFMTLEAKKVAGALDASGLKFWGNFDLPPGDYLVRALVRRGDNGWHALRTVTLVVPDFASGQTTLLPPFFPEPIGKWLLTREPGAIREELPYPFMFAGEPFIPAARPLVVPGEETRLALVGFFPEGDSLEVESRILDAEGGATPAQVSLSRLANAPTDTPLQLYGQLRLTRMAPGPYQLEVTVRDPTSGSSATSSTPITVQ